MVGIWSLLNELRPLVTKPAVKARLIRCYDTTSSKIEAPNSFECIFHDEEGTRFHFTALKNIASKFRSKFEEGKNYAIRNFGVTHNTSKFRVTPQKFNATFYENTKVRAESNKSFPDLMYAFKAFGDIQAIDNIGDVVPIDVIGRVAFPGKPSNVKTRDGKEKRVMNLILEDTE